MKAEGPSHSHLNIFSVPLADHSTRLWANLNVSQSQTEKPMETAKVISYILNLEAGKAVLNTLA